MAYAASGLTAYILAGTVHVLSHRALHGLFPDAYQVRQFSTYLLDVLPIYIAGVFAITVALQLLIFRRVDVDDQVSFRLWAAVNVATVLVAVGVHSFLFPTTGAALVILVIVSVFFSATYPVIARIPILWKRWWAGPRFLPSVSRVSPGLITGLVFAGVYVIGFRVAIDARWVQNDKIYTAARESTSAAYIYKSSGQTERIARPKPYSLSRPLPELFVRERFQLGDMPNLEATPDGGESAARDFGGRSFRFLDLDKNGYTDIVFRDKAGRLELWLNKGGRFKKASGFLEPGLNEHVHDFYFGDFDNDGRDDMLVSRFIQPKVSSFENTFLKQIYWYPTEKPAAVGHLYRQVAIDNWQDVTKLTFPGGAPQAYRKVEPMLWFDANSDGRLDFVWSQYPHPRYSLNALYVQNDAGAFADQFNQLIEGTSSRVFAEGADVGDADGDGDVDLFAFGYLYQKEAGRFQRICGKAMPGMYCDATARNDEGGTFEDFDGDGLIDLALSYHGASPEIPNYYLQLFRGVHSAGDNFKREEKWERQFYGVHNILRAKDFDFNGRPDLMTATPGRLLTIAGDQWLDMLPAITGKARQPIVPLGWIDVDEDGDWDFLAAENEHLWLFRNNYNPERYVKVSLLGEKGRNNQIGATLRLKLPEGRRITHIHRTMGGYAGVTDPRLIFVPEPDQEYEMEVCYASLLSAPSNPALPAGVQLKISASQKPNCIDYRLTVSKDLVRADLNLIAGAKGAEAIVTKRPRE